VSESVKETSRFLSLKFIFVLEIFSLSCIKIRVLLP
jgi:hypothetical protein